MAFMSETHKNILIDLPQDLKIIIVNCLIKNDKIFSILRRTNREFLTLADNAYYLLHKDDPITEKEYNEYLSSGNTVFYATLNKCHSIEKCEYSYVYDLNMNEGIQRIVSQYRIEYPLRNKNTHIDARYDNEILEKGCYVSDCTPYINDDGSPPYFNKYTEIDIYTYYGILFSRKDIQRVNPDYAYDVSIKLLKEKYEKYKQFNDCISIFALYLYLKFTAAVMNLKTGIPFDIDFLLVIPCENPKIEYIYNPESDYFQTEILSIKDMPEYHTKIDIIYNKIIQRLKNIHSEN
jgi:hypothetical protein